MSGRRAIKSVQQTMSHPHRINLKPYRKRSGFTQQELGFLLGLKQHSCISRYEAGESNPSLETALAYQAVFGRELQELFPELQGKVSSSVGERAKQLSQRLRCGDEKRKTAYKLEKLANLQRGALASASCV